MRMLFTKNDKDFYIHIKLFGSHNTFVPKKISISIISHDAVIQSGLRISTVLSNAQLGYGKIKIL